ALDRRAPRARRARRHARVRSRRLPAARAGMGHDLEAGTTTSPREAYEARRRARQAVVERLDRADARIANARLAVFLAAGGVAWLAWARGLSWWWLLLPGAAFVALLVVHDRLLVRRELGRASCREGASALVRAVSFAVTIE